MINYPPFIEIPYGFTDSPIILNTNQIIAIYFTKNSDIIIEMSNGSEFIFHEKDLHKPIATLFQDLEKILLPRMKQ